MNSLVMHDVLCGDDEKPQHEAAHDVRLEGALVEPAEALLQRAPPEPQRPRAHVIYAHTPVAAHLYRVVYYVILLSRVVSGVIMLELKGAIYVYIF